MNAWDTLRDVLAQARDIDNAISSHAERMAEMLNRPGNLRRVSAYELKKMKRQLRDFDMTTGKWKAHG
jgi:hypothetical protein